MTRRAHGTGSVYRRKQDGKWVASVPLEVPRGAPRRRRSFIANTREEAEAKLDAYHKIDPPKEYPGRKTQEDRARARGERITATQWWALVRSVGKKCHYCGIITDCVWTARTDPRHTTKDHLVPLWRGGSDTIDNVVVSCFACNVDKGRMTADEYRAWKDAA